MAEKWFLASKGKGFGPFSPAQLKQMVEAGLADHDDLVWQHGDSESIPVSAIGAQPPPLPGKTSPSPPPLPTNQKSESSGSILMGWLSIAIFMLVVFGGGGWFAYQQGWLPFADSLLLNDSVAESVATTENDGATEQNESPPSEEKNEEHDSKVGAVDPPQPAAVAAEKPEPKHEDLRSSNAGTVASGNVALASKGTTVTPDIRNSWAVNDGKSPDSWREYAKASLNEPIVLTLASAHELQSIRIELVGGDGYRYLVEVSADGKTYEIVQDRRNGGSWIGWQTVSFPVRRVKTIRLTGTYDAPNQTGIRVGEIEAYCTQ